MAPELDGLIQGYLDCYDVNGHLQSVTDTTLASKNRSFVNDANGTALYASQTGHNQRQLVLNGEVLGRYGQLVDEKTPADANGNPVFVARSEFSFGYQAIGTSYPAGAPSQHAVVEGETLQGIAKGAYGDASLWYLIAEANGLGGSADLKVGQVLTIPARVGSANNASSFKPYDPGKVVEAAPRSGSAPPTPAAKQSCASLDVLEEFLPYSHTRKKAVLSMYMIAFLNHARAVRKWSKANSAETSMDLDTFQLEIKCRNRYFRMHPQFRARLHGRLGNVSQISDEITGFLGWLPYKPLQWPLSTDKLLFKKYIREQGARTPHWWAADTAPESDFIVKRSVGSFGQNISGPYLAGAKTVRLDRTPPGAPGTNFLEQFIWGTNIKLWIWGQDIFHAHVDPYPAIVGDGERSIDQLIKSLEDKQTPRVPRPMEDAAEIADSLAYQGQSANAVLETGASVWTNFRYGRGYTSMPITEAEDNALPRLSSHVLNQARDAAKLITANAADKFSAPILYSLDGVVDENERAWWLEVNSNPTLPPSGYDRIFSTLFGSVK